MKLWMQRRFVMCRGSLGLVNVQWGCIHVYCKTVLQCLFCLKGNWQRAFDGIYWISTVGFVVKANEILQGNFWEHLMLHMSVPEQVKLSMWLPLMLHLLHWCLQASFQLFMSMEGDIEANFPYPCWFTRALAWNDRKNIEKILILC